MLLLSFFLIIFIAIACRFSPLSLIFDVTLIRRRLPRHITPHYATRAAFAAFFLFRSPIYVIDIYDY